MEHSITVAQALIIALWVALVESRALGYATLNLRFSPLMTGLVVGLVMGDVPTAMIATASIQLIYMGMIAPGGAMPSEPAVATAIAVPVAILGGLKPTEAIAVAVPVGLLGSYLYQFRFFLNTFITRLTDKYAAQLNDKGLNFSIIILPTIISFALFTPAMFIALYYGTPVIAKFTATLSGGRIFHILDVIGGGLAALGIALILQVIGKKKYLVFFLLAYFVSVMLQPLKINTVTFAIIGTIVAYLYILVTGEKTETN
ncbi:MULTISPECIES: PTS mannose/fructose/sorbose/N-acetylgalactosamine transporter subunit IIC [Tissierellales]|jgi:PTS system mannose-specific IIC component|uniref:PTS sugar transporter subunit IIC n=1 Tax=Acidilutibacter cellobiosedens TaxID=2507161 RepID=A0A410QBR8_9FIRM|nr:MULTISPECIES: PTS sugar transporter subunit IIC [Tissierellales]MBE6082184.1 PTS sugar transporter subunit IIC [Tissierellaceae bacterium]QAT61298.1 PTS sugar transporter subunit IIC [Acidilutibacter cellobiosedens]SCL95201.1 PTS system N-acetylgalactosamine-specific EIIC component 1 [Sporanaerobacter sp. PP17-6a]